MINLKYTPCIHSYTYLECEDCQRWVFGIEANILAKDSLHITNSGCHASGKKTSEHCRPRSGIQTGGVIFTTVNFNNSINVWKKRAQPFHYY
ncbi:MAG TPA: hypothetical protein VJ991_08295 [Balneolales bacterium]|nr:hypothetical protein [Balneolales bacterium]